MYFSFVQSLFQGWENLFLGAALSGFACPIGYTLKTKVNVIDTTQHCFLFFII